MLRLAMVAAAALVLVTGPVRAAEECPTSGLEEIEKVLREAPTCKRSLQLFQVCSFGASGDVSLGAAVTERCEKDFLATLKTAERKAYDRGQAQCARKHRHQSGTMYRSFEAFCGAQLAEKYASRLQKAAGSTSKRPGS